jgi:hypothetical protein
MSNSFFVYGTDEVFGHHNSCGKVNPSSSTCTLDLQINRERLSRTKQNDQKLIKEQRVPARNWNSFTIKNDRYSFWAKKIDFFL